MMNYATNNHIGNNFPNPQQAAIPTVPAVGRVCQVDATPQRPQRNPQGQTPIRTADAFAHGFLKSRFLPKLAIDPNLAKLSGKQVEQRERDFYRSLSQLALHYGFSLMQTACYPYPYNLTLAYWDAERQIRQSPKGENFEEMKILEKDNTKQVFLSVTETYDTGMYFYYVPVLPLFRMLKEPERRYTAQLLLSVFSYLYRMVNVPYYREKHSFLYWQYEMLEEWAIHDEDSEENRTILTELDQAEKTGEQMQRKLSAKSNLSHWKRRIQSFKAKDTFDSDVFRLVVKFHLLYEQFPERTLDFTSAWNETDYYYDEEETKITMDKYIGFIADCNGILYDQLCDTVNQEFSQYAEMEEPTTTHHFDGTPTQKDLLDFENRLFPLVSELCNLLNRENDR